MIPLDPAETPAPSFSKTVHDSDESPATQASAPEPAATAPSTPETDSGLALAAQDGFLETPPAVKMPSLDTSHLSLVSGPDWTLEDCEPTVATTPVADVSHLSLVETDPIPDTQRSTD